MSIKIHWGPPGSYKTSGAVQDDFVKAAKDGRIVITNVRGLNDRQRVIDVLGLSQDTTFDIIHLDTVKKENREFLERWFHWAPAGAFFFIDEAQDIWRKAWKEKQLAAFDFPIEKVVDGKVVGRYGSSIEAAEANKLEVVQPDGTVKLVPRPYCFLQAFEMHRHYNWDLVLTTPHITKIHEAIRTCSEGGYKHSNQALVGIKGRYLEGFHSASTNGNSKLDFFSVRRRKIDKKVFQLYESTTTGVVKDTQAGLALWKDPKLIGLFLFLGCVLFYLFFFSKPISFFAGRNKANNQTTQKVLPDTSKPIQTPVIENTKLVIQDKPVSSSLNISPKNSDVAISLEPTMHGYTWVVSGSYGEVSKPTIVFHLFKEDGSYTVFNSKELYYYGYRFKRLDDKGFIVQVSYEGQTIIASSKRFSHSVIPERSHDFIQSSKQFIASN